MTDPYRFADVDEVIQQFPPDADTILVDAYLSDRDNASIRLFRLYHPLPAHHHEQCDELLFLLRGRVQFEIAGEAERTLGAGQLVIFRRGVVHRVAPVLGEPAIFLTADTPRRDPKDVHFAEPRPAGGRAFVSHLPGYEPGKG